MGGAHRHDRWMWAVGGTLVGGEAVGVLSSLIGAEDPPTNEKAPKPEPDKLNAAAAKLGTALGATVAILGFFGVKNGELDRVLRDAPLESVVLFSMVFVGVGLSFVVPMVTSRIRLAFVGLVVVLAALVAYGAVSRFGDESVDVSVVEALFIASVLILVWASWRIRVGAKPATLFIAAAYFGIGTIGATALAVDVRAANDTVGISASLTKDGALSVEVSASRLDAGQSVGIDILGVPTGASDDTPKVCRAADCVRLHQVRIGPDGDGNVKQTLKLDIPVGALDRVLARGTVCSEPVTSDPGDDRKSAGDDSQPTEDDCVAIDPLTGFALLAVNPAPATPVVSLTTSADTTNFNAKATGVHDSSRLCGRAVLDSGEVTATISQGVTAGGVAEFVLPLPVQPRPAVVSAHAWIASGACGVPPDDAAELTTRLAAPSSTTTTTMPAAEVPD